MLLFHGTTYNRFMKILKDGYIGSKDVVWTASQPETTYFWGEDYLREEYEDYWYEEGIRLALESAEIALSQERKNLKRVVIIVDSEKLDGEVEEDISCGESMMDCKQYSGRISINAIYRVYIDKDDLDMYCLYFIGISTNRWDMGGQRVINFEEGIDNKLWAISKMVYEKLCEWWIENMYDIDELEAYEIKREE